MALLDTLFIAFRADTHDLKKGSEEVEQVLEKTKKTAEAADTATEKLGETFTDTGQSAVHSSAAVEQLADTINQLLSVIRDTADLEQFSEVIDKKIGNAFQDTIKNAASAITALVGVGAVANRVIMQATSTEALGNFSRSINANIEDVAAWGKAVEQQGGTAAEFEGSLKGLHDSLTQLMRTGGGPAAEALAILGIQAQDATGNWKNAFTVLEEVSEKLPHVNKNLALAISQDLGLDQGTIRLLQQGRRELDLQIQKQKELGVPTKENFETAQNFNNALRDFKTVVELSSLEIGNNLLPAFAGLLRGGESLIQFFRDNEDFAVGFFTVVGTAAAIYAVKVGAAALATNSLILPFLGVSAAVVAVASGFALFVSEVRAFIDDRPNLISAGKDLIAGWLPESVIKFFADGEETEKGMNSVQGNFFATGPTPALPGATTTNTKNTSVTVKELNVDARGANSQEISENISSDLKEQLSTTISSFDDMVRV